MTCDATKIYFVRHGETVWNTQKRWQGSQNSELTDLGKQQAAQARDLLKEMHFDLAYVSPLQRAVQTINIILEGRGMDIATLPAVQEINMGQWEGRTQAEIAISEPEQANNFWHNPDLFNVDGAETFTQLQQRVVQGLNELFDKHQGCNILVVSHWVAIKVALAYYSNIELKNLSDLPNPKNAELICFTKSGDKISVS
jgi:probable phosphoglycerate mutase